MSSLGHVSVDLPKAPQTDSSSPVNDSLLESLRGKTIGEVILMRDGIQQIQKIGDLLDEDLEGLEKLKCKLQERDEIALAIGTSLLLHRQPDGEYAPYAEGSRLGIHFHLDLFALFTLLDDEWLSSTVIDCILAKFAEPSSGVQLASSEMVFWLFCKLQGNLPIELSDTISLQPDIHTLIFPFNLSTNHWCVGKATFYNGAGLHRQYQPSPQHHDGASLEQDSMGLGGLGCRG